MSTPSTTNPNQQKPRPASPHLSSDILLAYFKDLTTRRQYTTVEKGPEGGEITELVPIARACRLEETNEQRLALAKFVLGYAMQLLEYEHLLERRANELPMAPGTGHDFTAGGLN